MISTSPASAQCVVPPGVVGCIAVGCAVRWLTQRRKDPHNREGDHNEDQGNNLYAGTHLAVTVHDGGSSGVGNDTWAHIAGPCGTSGANYPITAGNLTVFGG